MSGAPQNEDYKNRVQAVTEQRTSHQPELLCRYRFLDRLTFRHSGKHTGILTFSCTDVTPALSTEATVSINMRVTIDGRPVQITVRTGATVDDCRRVMGVMQEVLAEHPDTPTLVASTQAPLCSVHKTAMQVSKFGGYFCPRKNADGSHCKQKAA